jgi:hypothetical protein
MIRFGLLDVDVSPIVNPSCWEAIPFGPVKLFVVKPNRFNVPVVKARESRQQLTCLRSVLQEVITSAGWR